MFEVTVDEHKFVPAHDRGPDLEDAVRNAVFAVRAAGIEEKDFVVCHGRRRLSGHFPCCAAEGNSEPGKMAAERD